MSNKCPDCGGPTIEMLFSRVCKAGCDLKRKAGNAPAAEGDPWRLSEDGTYKYRVKGDCGVLTIPKTALGGSPGSRPVAPAVPGNLGTGIVPNAGIAGNKTSWTHAFPFAVYSDEQDLINALQAQGAGRLGHRCAGTFSNVGQSTYFPVSCKKLHGVAFRDLSNSVLIPPQQIKYLAVYWCDKIEVSVKPAGNIFAYVFFYEP